MQAHRINFWESANQFVISAFLQMLPTEGPFQEIFIIPALYSLEIGLDKFFLQMCSDHCIPHSSSALSIYFIAYSVIECPTIDPSTSFPNLSPETFRCD